MPTISELGQKVKAKYPGQYDDLSDDDLGKKIKTKYPDDYKDFTDAAFAKPKSVSERASSNLAVSGTDRAGAKTKAEGIQKAGEQEQASSDKKAYGQFASTMIKGGVVAGATLATGGLAIGPALALMGGAGLASSVIGQGIEEATGTHKGVGERAVQAGFDTGTALLGEGVGRGIGFIGKTLIPKMAAKAAAGTVRGSKLFETMYQDTSQQLLGTVRNAIAEAPIAPAARSAAKTAGDVVVRPELDVATGTPLIDVSGPLSKAYKRIGQLPFVKGPMGRFGGMSDKVQELMGAIESKLKTVDGQIGSHQPLDELIEMKRSLQSFAYKEKDINRLARPIIKDLAADLDSSIRASLKTLGPEASALYQKTNDIVTTMYKAEAAQDITKVVIKRMVMSSLGGGVGYAYGGGHGATAGAVAGIAFPEISSLVLEQVAAHPKAAALMRQAVTAVEQGAKSAPELARRAMEMAGADDTVKQTIDQVKSEQVSMGQQ